MTRRGRFSKERRCAGNGGRIADASVNAFFDRVRLDENRPNPGLIYWCNGAPVLLSRGASYGFALEHRTSGFHPSVGVERTAELLIERYGFHAFDFATEQAKLLADTGAHASVAHWRAVAKAIEELLARKRGYLN